MWCNKTSFIYGLMALVSRGATSCSTCCIADVIYNWHVDPSENFGRGKICLIPYWYWEHVYSSGSINRLASNLQFLICMPWFRGGRRGGTGRQNRVVVLVRDNLNWRVTQNRSRHRHLLGMQRKRDIITSIWFTFITIPCFSLMSRVGSSELKSRW